jgi:spermidine synthase
VAPLALYLLTFVLVFARRPPFSRTIMLVVQLFLVLGLLVVMSANPTKRVTTVALLHLLTFFVTAMVCHRELAEARPRASHLTEFYLWMSLGGVLGGVFNVLLAPLLYDRILEYPFALIIALGLRPSPSAASGPRDRPMLFDLLLPIALFGVVTGGLHFLSPLEQWGDHALYLYLGVAALAAAACYKRPLRLALAAGAVLVAADAGIGRDDNTILRARSFFGVYSVRRWNDYVILQHGTTTHGAQSIRVDQRTDPLTYYHRQGPLGDIFRLATDPRAPRSVAVVGLGTGTTACYSRPGEHWTYFEIDSVVVRIARSPALFTYLRDCQPNAQVVLGDARRSLANSRDASFDLIVLDAFSSDAIPVHLITQQALRLYQRKLRPGGMVAFHISNRYLELRPVLVELARDAHMAGATADRDVTAAQKAQLYYGSRWVVLAPSARSLEPLIRDAHWEALASSAPVHLWTDDYSDVLGVMRWKQ